MVRKVPTAIAARVLGKSEDFIRFGLQQQVFDFGRAVKTRENRWSYHISPKGLAEYSGFPLMRIEQMVEEYGEDKEDDDACM